MCAKLIIRLEWTLLVWTLFITEAVPVPTPQTILDRTDQNCLVEFKVHGSKLSWVCVRGACWHRIHLLQAWIGCWKGRLDKAWMNLDFAGDVSFLAELLPTPHSCAGDDGKWGIFARVQSELAEDKGPSYGHQGECAIDRHNSGPTDCSSW